MRVALFRVSAQRLIKTFLPHGAHVQIRKDSTTLLGVSVADSRCVKAGVDERPVEIRDPRLAVPDGRSTTRNESPRWSPPAPTTNRTGHPLKPVRAQPNPTLYGELLGSVLVR